MKGNENHQGRCPKIRTTYFAKVLSGHALDDLVNFDIVLPIQLEGAHRSAEKMFLVCILADAAGVLAKKPRIPCKRCRGLPGPCAECRKKQRRRTELLDEIEAWIMEPQGWELAPFPFPYLCEQLEVDPDYAGRRLLSQLESAKSACAADTPMIPSPPPIQTQHRRHLHLKIPGSGYLRREGHRKIVDTEDPRYPRRLTMTQVLERGL